MFVSFMDEFSWQLDDDALAMPLDVGRGAVLAPLLRHSLREEL